MRSVCRFCVKNGRKSADHAVLHKTFPWYHVTRKEVLRQKGDDTYENAGKYFMDHIRRVCERAGMDRGGMPLVHHHRRDPHRKAVLQTVLDLAEPVRERSRVWRRGGVLHREHPVDHILRDRTGDHQPGSGSDPLRHHRRDPVRDAVLQDREAVADAVWGASDQRALSVKGTKSIDA